LGRRRGRENEEFVSPAGGVVGLKDLPGGDCKVPPVLTRGKWRGSSRDGGWLEGRNAKFKRILWSLSLPRAVLVRAMPK